MSELPPPGTSLGRVDDLPDCTAREAVGHDGLVILSRRGDDVRAWVNACPHAGRSLSLPDGRVIIHEEKFLLCPVHGASFGMEDGRCVGGPAVGDRLRAIPVEIINGEILTVQA
jgi:nitrite reductase/ring-hydroxylating ferredoxin subunit